jgi:predicted nuclease of predicted toxin-antitoxin system
MKDILIKSILDSMNADTAYLTDMWEDCLDDKRKRYARNKFSIVLEKMEEFGYLKKQGYKTEITFTKLEFTDAADHIGFFNNIIFTNEAFIKKSLKKLDSKKIFIDISKDLNSQKFNKLILKDYDLFIKSVTTMLELSSTILLTIENTDDVELKKELKSCFKQIKEFLDETNEILMKFRGSNERIVLQRILNNRIPKPGCLKI